jgi:hypothetical protein
MPKVIGVVGTRKRDSEDDFKIVFESFKHIYSPGDTICSGLCSHGADRFAVIIANTYALPNSNRLWFPADWKKYGKSAGFIRNEYIAKISDILIACVSSDRIGGTEDTISKFIRIHGKDNLILV